MEKKMFEKTKKTDFYQGKIENRLKFEISKQLRGFFFTLRYFTTYKNSYNTSYIDKLYTR